MPRSDVLAKKPRASAVTALVVTVATLYFAQEVLIPLALSVLLAFLLAPLATRLERRRVGRVASVLVVVGVAFLFISALGWVVGRQVYKLAEDLPQYQDEIVRKARRVQGTGAGFGSKIERLGEEIEKASARPSSQPAAPAATQPAPGGPPLGVAQAAAKQIGDDPVGAVARQAVGGPPAAAPSAAGTTPANPLFTVALPAPVSPVKTLGTYLGLVLGPLGTAGLVLVFVVFMLLERHDLRDRLIRLISRGKYTLTTRALNDAATRISKYMLAQALVNGSYGLTVAAGLWVIGLTVGGGTTFPSFVLWGLLCAVLRFIPYLGPFLAGAFPVALSLAVYQGFGVFAATLGLFVVIELVSNNVMEPWLYGTSTGLSAVALLVSSVFWTWLWGPVGLLMSTPLTVCLVVLGKHVPQLQFLDVLLGDQPALPPAVSYYQRLLAGDRIEAAAVVADVARAAGPDGVPDEVLIPALLHARRDRADDDLTAAHEAAIYDATEEIVARLGDGPPKAHPLAYAGGAKWEGVGRIDGNAVQGPPPPAPDPALPTVLGCPAHHRSEELVTRMLAAVAEPGAWRVEAASTRLLPAEIEARVEREGPAVVFVAVLPPGGLVQARYLCRRLRKRFPELKIVVGYWGRVRNFDRLLVRLRSAGASYVTTSVLQTRSQIKALVPPAPAARPPADELPVPLP